MFVEKSISTEHDLTGMSSLGVLVSVQLEQGSPSHAHGARGRAVVYGKRESRSQLASVQQHRWTLFVKMDTDHSFRAVSLSHITGLPTLQAA